MDDEDEDGRVEGRGAVKTRRGEANCVAVDSIECRSAAKRRDCTGFFFLFNSDDGLFSLS